MKVPVEERTTVEVDVELPMYGEWFDDVDDGRVSWETVFCIDELLQMRTVTSWFGDTPNKWRIELSKITPEMVGHYVGKRAITADQFKDRLAQALQFIGEAK